MSTVLTLTDLAVSASRSLELITDSLSADASVSYGAPVNKDLYKYSNSKGTLGGSLGLSYSFPGQLNPR